jgi:hypothetical protein
MKAKRPALAMLLGMIDGSTGMILTVGFPSSSIPSHLRQVYFGRIVCST